MCKEFLREGESVEELLEGGLKIIQDKSLYRFTSDSVLLSRFAKGKKGEIRSPISARAAASWGCTFTRSTRTFPP